MQPSADPQKSAKVILLQFIEVCVYNNITVFQYWYIMSHVHVCAHNVIEYSTVKYDIFLIDKLE